MAFIFKILLMPTDESIQILLRNKHWELLRRINGDGSPADQIDTLCLLSIINELLTFKKADAKLIFEDLMVKPGFSHEAFYNACNVVEDYLLTGGKNVRETVIKKCPLKK